MGTILFLVESPHKAETLKHILSKDYTVIATVGHMMDLDPKTMSIDIENNFTPLYINNADKSDVIAKIKAAAKKVDKIIFASDPDREGEMIAWGAAKILGVKNPQRVTYTEITKDAILNAIKHPRDLDMTLIDAQKTRRILDRIVGYEISPILGKALSIKSLSAGRVQSVVTRLIIDKEIEIREFLKKDLPAIFKFNGELLLKEDVLAVSLFNKGESDDDDKQKKQVSKDDDDNNDNDDSEKGVVKISSAEKAKELMGKFCKSIFNVASIKEKMLTRNPSPPFSTSSMQQASANKLGYAVKRTMSAAQNLYEGGYITYLRTDSVNLSDEALKNIGKYVVDKFGDKYYSKTQYKSKSKNTQEAHEAIRPTDINVVDNLTGKKIGNDELRLYSLIWKRSVASQMSPAKIKQIKVHINIDNVSKYEFISKTEVVEFAGFLKVYNIEDIEKETTDTVGAIKTMPKVGDIVKLGMINGKQSYPKPPSRYSDATLVNKMKPENLNLGRPATTQSIITKIQEREYVKKGDVDGFEKDIISLTVDKSKKVNVKTEKIMFGKEINRFIPTELGFKVTEFLMKYFPNIMDYKFTSEMEEKLDEIAEGKVKWLNVMKPFYKDFHPNVEKIKSEMKELIKKNTRVLGPHPKTGSDIVVALGRFGPVVQMYPTKKVKGVGQKLIYAPIRAPLTMETITLKDALELFEYPKHLGKYDEIDVVLQRGKFGYYLIYGTEKVSVGDKEHITLDEAIEEIKKKETKNLWKAVDGKTMYKVLDGKFGPYVNVSGATRKKALNIKLPKDTDISKLTLEKVKEIASSWKPKRKFVKKAKE